MKSQYSFVILCLVFGILSGACHKAPPRVATEGGVRNAAAILVERSLKESEDRVKTLRGLAKAILTDKDEERHADVALVIVRPDHVRVDAFDNLADVWAAAGSDGSRLWLWLPQKHKLYQGSATARNMKRLADFDWELSEVTSIAAGLIPDARQAELVQIPGGEKGRYSFRDRPMHIWVDPKKRRPLRLVRYYLPQKDDESSAISEEVQYEVSFSDYRVVGDVEFPHKIDVTFPGRSCSLSLYYRDVEFNAEIKASLFKPEDVWQGKRVEMDK